MRVVLLDEGVTKSYPFSNAESETRVAMKKRSILTSFSASPQVYKITHLRIRSNKVAQHVAEYTAVFEVLNLKWGINTGFHLKGFIIGFHG